MGSYRLKSLPFKEKNWESHMVNPKNIVGIEREFMKFRCLDCYIFGVPVPGSPFVPAASIALL